MASTGERVADCAFCEPDQRNLLYNDATRWPVAPGVHIWPALGMLRQYAGL